MGDDGFDELSVDDSYGASTGDAGSSDGYADDSSDISGTDGGLPQADVLGGAAPAASEAGGGATQGDAVAVAQMGDGRVMTVPTWGGEQAHIWHEGTNLTGPNARIVGDERGNMVAWNPDTGEVTTAVKDQDQPRGTSAYTVSRDLPSFDE